MYQYGGAMIRPVYRRIWSWIVMLVSWAGIGAVVLLLYLLMFWLSLRVVEFLEVNQVLP